LDQASTAISTASLLVRRRQFHERGGETRVLPESLEETARRIRQALTG
jgi:hypothetical protein